jgi:hypothetical protein
MIEKEYSQDVAMRIDQEVAKIMNDQLARAKEVIIRHKHVLDAIAMELIHVETIEHEEFEKILTLHGIKPKRKVGDDIYVAPRVVVDEEEKPAIKSESMVPAPDARPDQVLFAKQPPTPFATVTHETVESVVSEDTPQPKHGKKKEMKRSGEKTEEEK